MAKRTTYYAILPILNEKCTTFKGPSWWISDNLQVRTLFEHEARFLTENSPRNFQHSLEEGQKVLIFNKLDNGKFTTVKSKHQENLLSVSLSSQIALNLVSDLNPIFMPYAIVLSHAYTTKLKAIFEFDTWGDSIALKKRNYRINPTIRLEEVKELYKITVASIAARKDMEITLSRFCSALLKTNIQDKIIDLTIALESLLPGGGEFNFRFPYFLSLIIESDRNERMKIYKTLKVLYDARSALVHGSHDWERRSKEIVSDWPTILSYGKQCIIYYLVFHSSQRDLDWKSHLEQLSYGEARIV